MVRTPAHNHNDTGSALGIETSNTRFSCVDYASNTWTQDVAANSAKTTTSQPKTRTGIRSAINRKAVTANQSRRSARSTPGAVRLSEAADYGSRHTGKLIAGLVFAAGGILVTTTSTGTVEQAPRLLFTSTSIAPPAFFFDDANDALGELDAADALTTALALPGVSIADPTATPTDSTDVTSDTQPAGISSHPSVQAVRDRNAAPLGAVTDTYTVVSGDTLSGLLNRFGVKADHMPQVLTDDAVKKHLTALRVGQELDVTRLADGDFHSLSAKVGQERRVTIRRGENGLAVAAIDLPVEKERVVSSGTIEQSLFLAAKQANLKQSTIMELADIFQWELDFARDIRSGDQFSVVYDRLYREGRYIGDGDILAAEFIRGSKSFSAVRFTDDEGNTAYYSPDGRAKKRTFERHPVDVVRITSRFDPDRLHPVLGVRRPHRGVDYGIPHGSPIKATADGVVEYSGTKGAYGKTVVLRHGNNVTTLYAHMSKIADRSIVGKRIRQGQVIGYVGRTGRVTGTHLHYEFRKRGVHVDPLLVELPHAAPLAEKYRDELKLLSDQMTAQMRSVIPPAETLADASSN